ncbi:MAG: hypothetical protein IPO92_04545 [Saprospiraceae bacterium]|nr:hypothetical protein [Saprospiraceae bacterium]
MTIRLYSVCFYQIVILLWLPVLLFSQTAYQSTEYTTKDGLSSANCRKIYKDKVGFVWISSDKGLNRYDGNSFHIFRHRPDDATSIASNSCNAMFEDSQGRFWVNTDEGLSLFDRAKQVFTNFYPDTTVLPVIGLSYTQMTEDVQNRIWIGGYYDVLIFDPNTKKFKKSGWYDFAIKSGIISYEKRNSISQSIVKKSDTELWILTVYGLFSVHTPTMTYTYHANPEVNDYWAFYIDVIDPEGVLWIGSYDDCFYTYDPKTRIWNHHVCPLSNISYANQMLHIKYYNRDTMLMIRSRQPYFYHIKTQTFSPFTFIPKAKEKAESIYENFMIYGDQMYFLKSEPTPFIHLRKKQVYIQSKKIPLPKGFVNNHSYFTKNGKIITGDWLKGQVILCSQNKCVQIKDQFGSANLGSLQLYYESKNGKQYFSTSQAVYVLNEAENKAQLLIIPNASNKVQHNEFRNFTEDSKGNIYIRERNRGIYILQNGQTNIEVFDKTLQGQYFSALHFDKLTNKLWLASEKNGLYIIDPETKFIEKYPLTKGLSSKKGYVNDISGDEHGNVFLLMPGLGLMYIQSKSKNPNFILALKA